MMHCVQYDFYIPICASEAAQYSQEAVWLFLQGSAFYSFFPPLFFPFHCKVLYLLKFPILNKCFCKQQNMQTLLELYKISLF